MKLIPSLYKEKMYTRGLKIKALKLKYGGTILYMYQYPLQVWYGYIVKFKVFVHQSVKIYGRKWSVITQVITCLQGIKQEKKNTHIKIVHTDYVVKDQNNQIMFEVEL